MAISPPTAPVTASSIVAPATLCSRRSPALGAAASQALVATRVREELLLVVHAVDLAGRSSQQRHRATTEPCTRATGSRSGELSGSRPLARGWASPRGRPFNRPPASQGTRSMSGGRDIHRASLSLSSDTHARAGRDTSRSSSAISRRSRARARCATLRYFSGGPAVAAAEVARGSSAVQPDRRGPAAGRGSAPARATARDAGPGAGSRASRARLAHRRCRSAPRSHAVEGHGRLERRLHRAAPGKRSTAIVDPRDRNAARACSPDAARLENVASATRVRHQLERGLAVAVLEILPAQPVAVRAQQQLALGARHQRHLLGRVEPRRGPAAVLRPGARPVLVLSAHIE